MKFTWHTIVPSAVAAAISVAVGLQRAHYYSAAARSFGMSPQRVGKAWNDAIEVWCWLAVTSAVAVFAVTSASYVAHRYRSRAVAALLVLLAPIILFFGGVGAYVPSWRSIQEGWYPNVGELATFWGWTCGIPVVVLGEIAWYLANRLRPD